MDAVRPIDSSQPRREKQKRKSSYLVLSTALGLGALLVTLVLLSASGSQVRAGLAPASAEYGVAQSTSAHRWLSETVETDGEGWYTSLALEPVTPYTPHISYYDYDNSSLKHAWWTPSGWLSETVDDSSVYVGWYSSLALEPVAPYTPHISYYDYDNSSLKHAWWTPSGWLSETVDNSAEVGEFTSLSLEPVAPYASHISYLDRTNTSLKHAWWTPSGWLSETVDDSGWFGAWTSLALEPATPYTVHISYNGDGDDNILKHAWWTSSGWVSETVDSSWGAGSFSSLTLEPVTPYAPRISYQDSAKESLMYAWWTPSGWLSETVDSSGLVGKYTSLALVPTAPFVPHISYYDNTIHAPKHAWWTSSGWLSETVDSSSGYAGHWTSLAVEPVTPYTPHISYADSSLSALKHAWLVIPRRVLFDEAHGEQNTLSWERAQQLIPSNPEWIYFGELSSTLSSEFTLVRNPDATLTPQLLQGYDALILAAPEDAFSDGEIAAIRQFVSTGGGLIVLGECGLHHPANPLLSDYDIAFDEHCLWSPIPDRGSDFEVTDFASHPAVNGVSSFRTNGIQTLEFGSGATGLAWTDTNVWQDINWNETYDAGTDPTGSFVLMAGNDTGYGRVVALSDNSFQDDGFEWRGNAPLMRALLLWVTDGQKRDLAFVYLPLTLRNKP